MDCFLFVERLECVPELGTPEVGGIGEARFGGGLPSKVGVVAEVLLEEWPVPQVFEPAGALRHGGFEDLGSDGEQQVAWRRDAEHRILHPVGGLYPLGEVERLRPVDRDIVRLEEGGEVVQLLIGRVLHFLWHRTVRSGRKAMLGEAGCGGRFGRLDHRAVGPPDDDASEATPLVP